MAEDELSASTVKPRTISPALAPSLVDMKTLKEAWCACFQLLVSPFDNHGLTENKKEPDTLEVSQT